MREQTKYLSHKTSIVNNDISFLHELAQPSVQLESLKSTRANNIGNLGQLLRMKNSKFSFNEQSRENGQEWVRKKGADLSPLIQRVRQIKKDIKIKQQERKSESQCHFYISQLKYQNQNKYIQKNFEFGMMRTIQGIMSEQKCKGNLAKRVLEKRRTNRMNKQTSIMDSLPTINTQIRNPHKRYQYLKATKQILDFEANMDGTQWVKLYKHATKQQFWQIITNQVSNLLDCSNKSSPISIMAIASLQMVENSLNLLLPPHYDSVLHYLTNNYLGKMRGQYDSQGSLGPIWGICFLLYRAGRKDQFYRVIPNQQLRKSFQLADISIKQKKPKKYKVSDQTSDLFYNQLNYALKGVPKCATQALCNPNNLDIVWVFLRNVGIFSEDSSIFVNLRRQLYQSYKGPIIISQKIRNLLYLLGFTQIVEIGVNQIMDQDDYVHFLIAIYHSPLLNILIKDRKQFIQKKLTEQLVQYIQQLLLQYKDNSYICYMALIPHARMPDQISSIIASSHLLQILDWKYLQKRIPALTFQRLVHLSAQKYAAFHQDYIQVAKKQCQLLGNNKAALDMILKMMIKFVMSNKANSEQIKKADYFITDIMRRDEKLKSEYSPVFGFFDEYRKLVSLVQQRNQHKIYSFLRQCNHILISQQLRLQTKVALQKLMQFNGFQCYLLYVRTMIKAYEISLVRMNRIQDLKQLQGLTLAALLVLLRTQPYNSYINGDIAKQLLTLLQNAVCKSLIIS